MLRSLITVTVLGFFSHGTQAASFVPLGELPGGQVESFAEGVSADGRVVVGHSSGLTPTGEEGFLWTPASGMVGLRNLAGGAMDGVALGVSADGSVIVGYGIGASGQEAGVWTSGGGFVQLGTDIDIALGVSADGTVVVGQNGAGEAFRWTSTSGLVGLGDLPGGVFASRAESASADGAVIVGASVSGTGYVEAFRWTSDGGMVGLGNLLGAGGRSWAYDVSADGSVIVGNTTSDRGWESFRWTSAGGMASLGDLAGPNINNVARAVSADGAVVVGETGSDAFVWTEAGGMQYLLDVLVANGAAGLDGWRLVDATDVSADGRWIVGVGSGPLGTQAFLANIAPAAVPIPPAVWLFGSTLGLMGMMRRKQSVSG